MEDFMEANAAAERFTEVLAEHVRQLRKDLGLSQSELAQRIRDNGGRATQGYISHLENPGEEGGDRDPSASLLRALCLSLDGISADYLLGLTSVPRSSVEDPLQICVDVEDQRDRSTLQDWIAFAKSLTPTERGVVLSLVRGLLEISRGRGV
jgi:transcriptional regulator with XRE-family HTH domain